MGGGLAIIAIAHGGRRLLSGYEAEEVSCCYHQQLSLEEWRLRWSSVVGFAWLPSSQVAEAGHVAPRDAWIPLAIAVMRATPLERQFVIVLSDPE